MHDDQTFDAILNRILARISDSYDKRQSAPIYASSAPISMELEAAYRSLDQALQNGFMMTADSEHQDLIAAEIGLQRIGATFALRKGIFNDAHGEPAAVPIGARFGSISTSVTYFAVSQIKLGEYVLQAEKAGEAGNEYFGAILPLDNGLDLGSAEIRDVLKYGEELETDEKLKNRFFAAVRKPVTSGNQYHYEQWALEVPGVGAARCQPLWNGPGTVRVLVTDTDMRPADEKLTGEAAAYIETVRPVGAAVTVSPPTEKAVDVSVKVTLAGGTYLEAVKQSIKEKVGAYLRGLTFAGSFVSLALIGSMMLDVPGVLDYEELTLNGSVANVRVEETQVPVLGTVEVRV